MPMRPLLISLALILSSAAFAQTTPPAQYQVTTESGLQYTDVTVGKGFYPQLGQKVTVQYSAMFDDGREFDQNNAYQFIFGRGYVVKGMEQGVATMKVGGHRLLRVPASLGYGKDGYKAVPPNATLLFDVQVMAIQ